VAYEFAFDAKLRIIRITLSGAVSTTEALAHQDAALAHPDSFPGMRVLLDLRELESTPGTGSMRAYARRFEKTLSKNLPSMIAVVVGSEAMYGMNRMLAVLAEHLTVRIEPFRSYDEALAWLLRDDASEPERRE